MGRHGPEICLSPPSDNSCTNMCVNLTALPGQSPYIDCLHSITGPVTVHWLFAQHYRASHRTLTVCTALPGQSPYIDCLHSITGPVTVHWLFAQHYRASHRTLTVCTALPGQSPYIDCLHSITGPVTVHWLFAQHYRASHRTLTVYPHWQTIMIMKKWSHVTYRPHLRNRRFTRRADFQTSPTRLR